MVCTTSQYRKFWDSEVIGGIMKKLTDKQKEILTYIKLQMKSSSIQPTTAEMAEYFGISQTAIVKRLDGLVEKGFIQRTGKSRAIEILGGKK